MKRFRLCQIDIYFKLYVYNQYLKSCLTSKHKAAELGTFSTWICLLFEKQTKKCNYQNQTRDKKMDNLSIKEFIAINQLKCFILLQAHYLYKIGQVVYYYSMKRLNAQNFIGLAPEENVLLVVVRLSARKDIFNVVDAIDNQCLSYPDVFFAYELISTNTNTLQKNTYLCQIVMTYCPNEQLVEALFRKIPRCVLVRQTTINILGLYTHLSVTPFRAYNRLFFRRLKLSRAHEIVEGKNLLTRMCYYQNVLCLSNLGQEVSFLAQIKNDPTSWIRNYRCKTNRIIKQQQRIQYCLISNFREDIQFYLPPTERERLMKLCNYETNEDSEMKDCQYKMDIEMDSSTCEENLLLLSEELKKKELIEIRRDIKLDLCKHDQFFTERYRSRQNSR